jgi:hypothetical protein
MPLAATALPHRHRRASPVCARVQVWTFRSGRVGKASHARDVISVNANIDNTRWRKPKVVTDKA